jgi:hypothetical protein
MSSATLSNKRLESIRRELEENGVSDVDLVISCICRAMNFDPATYRKGCYTRENYERLKAWRVRKAHELGISVSAVARGKYRRQVVPPATPPDDVIEP